MLVSTKHHVSIVAFEWNRAVPSGYNQICSWPIVFNASKLSELKLDDDLNRKINLLTKWT